MIKNASVARQETALDHGCSLPQRCRSWHVLACDNAMLGWKSVNDSRALVRSSAKVIGLCLLVMGN